MRFLITLMLGIFFTANLFGQDDKVKALVKRGTELHDQGRYDEAIAEYKAALEIDKNSTVANYELSYTYMSTGKYDEAIKYSKKVIKQDTTNQHEAYVVLGSSLDMQGKQNKAISIFKEGLAKYPNSNLLNYNLALTYFKQKDYNKAEEAAINAVVAKPQHPGSHIILSAIMQAKGERVKSLLPLYYFLMLEPNSQRSVANYARVRKLLGLGVEQKDDRNISVTVPFNATKDKNNEFSAAEMMVSLLAASRYTEENKDKSDMDFFVESTKGLFSILGELKKENTGIWWDLYTTKFYDLVQLNNHEAFCYYISKSINSADVKKWIANNPAKMQSLKEWLNK